MSQFILKSWRAGSRTATYSSLVPRLKMGSSRKRIAETNVTDKCPKRSKLYQSDTMSPPLTVTVRGRTFEPTPVFDTFWRFAAERHAITEKRLEGLPAPYVSTHSSLVGPTQFIWQVDGRPHFTNLSVLQYVSGSRPSEPIFGHRSHRKRFSRSHRTCVSNSAFQYFHEHQNV